MVPICDTGHIEKQESLSNMLSPEKSASSPQSISPKPPLLGQGIDRIQKRDDNSGSPCRVSKKDRILQSIAASSPTSQSFANSPSKDKNPTLAITGRKRSSKESLFEENELEKRLCASEDTAPGKYKWLLVDGGGKAVFEATATARKVVSFLRAC